MAISMRDAMFQRLDELRYEPVERRVRALIGDDAVVDSSRPLFVWEPRRVVPSFAVPIEDVRGELVPAPAADEAGAGPPVLHPGIPFAVHSAAGESLSLRAGGATRESVAFARADPELAGHVVLDFKGFDRWLEEDEPLVGHARDPYHRIDMRCAGQAHVDAVVGVARMAASGSPPGPAVEALEVEDHVAGQPSGSAGEGHALARGAAGAQREALARGQCTANGIPGCRTGGPAPASSAAARHELAAHVLDRHGEGGTTRRGSQTKSGRLLSTTASSPMSARTRLSTGS